MRPLWKGALSFGLVNIPVRMYRAETSKELKFKMLHKKDLSEIRFARICKADGKEIPWEDVVKGYEYQKGDFIVLSEEDFSKVNLKKTSSIEIVSFVQEDQIDPIYYDTPYYLEAGKGAERSYLLLHAALTKSKKVALGRFVFHHHEHMGVISAYKNVLMIQQIRYYKDLVSCKEFEAIEHPVSKTELAMALKLIEELTEPFKPEKYTDTYTKEIKALIEKKAKGHKIVSPSAKKSPKVHEILSLLKESLKTKKNKRTKAA